MKMQQTNIIGDTWKDRRIDYGLIDRINKQYEREAKIDELKGKLAKKKKVKEEKESASNEEQNPKPDKIKYLKTPDELREIKGNYSLQRGIYIIDYEINVPNGGGLILEPGVEFYFTKDAGITCEGRFEAKGTRGLEILLAAKDEKDGWENLCLKGGAEAILDYAKFSYGKGRTNSYSNISGGAILLAAENGLKPSLTIINTSFENNSSLNCGGAIYNYKGDVIIKENNRFENNSAKSEGGAIFNDRGKISIKKNNIFENNSAEMKGGAIGNYKGTLNIDESKNIFKNNTPDDISEE